MELLIFLLGVVTAIVGYIVSNFLLRPIQQYREIEAKIGYKLTYYSHIITSPGAGELADEAEPILRDLACDLERAFLLVPLYDGISKIKVVPSPKKVIEAKGQLIFLSNSLGRDGSSSENHTALNKIFTILNIKELNPRHNIGIVSADE